MTGPSRPLGTPTITRRTVCSALGAAPLAAAAAFALPRAAAAQAYPSRPVRIILPFGAGGVADVTSRLAAEKLGEKLGQRFVIENQPGAGGITAARSVLSAAADGHTLGLVTNGTAISAALFKALPFDPVNEFEMISTLSYFELVFVTNAESPFRSLQDFVSAARAQPEKLNVGTITVGSTQNLGAELFKSTAAIGFQIVPFRNSPEAIVSLLRGDVDLVIEFPPAVRGALADKKIRALATSGARRSPVFPELPTVQESGVPGYDVTSWNGLFAPKGTPKAVVDIVNRTMREILADPVLQERYLELGVEARPSTPEELKARLVADIEKWAKVIERAGIPRQ
jgi:tripartite-type tricarboxylate transporter receptor subunit TctC